MWQKLMWEMVLYILQNETNVLAKSISFISFYPPGDAKSAQINRLAVNKNLVREFGQKKGKRMYEQNDRMQVDADKLDDKLSRAAMTVDQSSLETMLNSSIASSSNYFELTPPCNRYAYNLGR